MRRKTPGETDQISAFSRIMAVTATHFPSLGPVTNVRKSAKLCVAANGSYFQHNLCKLVSTRKKNQKNHTHKFSYMCPSGPLFV
jgi:hypothetical protein